MHENFIPFPCIDPWFTVMPTVHLHCMEKQLRHSAMKKFICVLQNKTINKYDRIKFFYFAIPLRIVKTIRKMLVWLISTWEKSYLSFNSSYRLNYCVIDSNIRVMWQRYLRRSYTSAVLQQPTATVIALRYSYIILIRQWWGCKGPPIEFITRGSTGKTKTLFRTKANQANAQN